MVSTITLKKDQITKGTQKLVCPQAPIRLAKTRWHDGRLWLLNSATSKLGWNNSGTFQPLCALPGFVGGLALHQGFA